jgi:DNA adenine methylase
MRPFLRWAGSKAQLLPTLASFWSNGYDRYVEPFAGSAALFFRLRPRRALLSDINGELIIALQQVQLQPSHVVECLHRLERSSSEYYRVRAQRPEDLPLNARAARFIYLNALCFNGLYRTNRQGVFNVPYGTKHRDDPFSLSDIRNAAKTLSSARVITCDFEECLSQVRAGDFVYLDPPYIDSTRRTFQYSGKDFNEGDLHRLFDSLHAISAVGARFILSYANSPEMSAFKRCWRSMRVVTRRNIAGFAGARKVAEEVLVTNIE